MAGQRDRYAHDHNLTVAITQGWGCDIISLDIYLYPVRWCGQMLVVVHSWFPAVISSQPPKFVCSGDGQMINNNSEIGLM